MGRSCSFWNCLKFQQSVTDNIVFQLQYKLTACILLILSIIVACHQYFRDPINCFSGDGEPPSVLNSYCYSHSTFSVEEYWNSTPGDYAIYPGVGKYDSNKKRVYHTYYQWVSLVLFLQAVLFLIPRYFWRTIEAGKIEELTSELQSSSVNTKENLKVLADEVTANFNNNQLYFAFYWVAEVLNVVNVIGQMFLMDAFLGGKFWDFGSQVIKSFGEENESPYFYYDGMLRVFPRMAKCTFRRFGASGLVQRRDVLCMLPVNSLNEKIYAFLWFWFLALLLLASSAVVYRLFIFLSPGLRLLVFKLRTRTDCGKLVQTVLSKGKAGDWFVLCLLSKNMKSAHFSELISALTDIPENKGMDEDRITFKL